MASPPAMPAVEQLSDTRYRLGNLEIDSAKRTISFPAKVEQNEVLVEYLLVAAHGKVHESVFLADISASALNIAMKLLHFQESKELIQILDENHASTGEYFTVQDQQRRRMARLGITVDWQDGDTLQSYHPYQLINVESTNSLMPQAPWIYSGSELNKGKLQADNTGDIIAIFTDRSALINYSGEGREDDTIWLPNKQLLPAIGTAVTITLTQTNKPTP